MLVGGGRARAGLETRRIVLSKTGPTGVEATGGTGEPGRGARGRWQGQGAPRDEANRPQQNGPHRCGGRRRDRKAWLQCPWAAAGPGRGAGRRRQGQGGPRDRPLRAKLACSDLAGGRTRRRPQHQRHHKQTRGSPTGAKDQAGCWWAASGPGRALRRRAEPHVSDRPPQVWRVPEGPEGTGGLRDRPLRAAGSRVAISRAAGPDGARNTSVTTSNTHRKAAAHRHTQRFGPQNKTRGSPSGPPRVHATSSYSTPSRGRVFSAVAQPRPRRPGPR